MYAKLAESTRYSKSGSSRSSTSRSKRKKTWGSRERAGMSFLIVIVFVAIFSIIIVTEMLMVEDRGKSGVGSEGRSNIYGNRFGESAPDYADVKEDYSLLFHNKVKAQEKKAQERAKSKETNIPWGSILPENVERDLPQYPKAAKPTDGSWQVVNGTRFKFFVYSAFYDRRGGGRLIRVVGATKTRGPEKVWCRLWYPLEQNSTKYRSVSVMSKVKVIRENFNLKYSACFVLCPLKSVGPEVPFAVSIVSKMFSPPGNILLVRNTDQDPDFVNQTITNIPNKIAICVKPIHFNYNQVLHLIEFLELNSILGISHFTFYNHTMSPQASCVFEKYMNQSWYLTNGTYDYPTITMTVLPWNLNMKSQIEIRTEGIFSALNECLYRNMYRYQYVAFVDLDEYIIPRKDETLFDLIEWFKNNKRTHDDNIGAYSFQNAFFYLQFADDDQMFEDKGYYGSLRNALITQRKTMRRSKLHPHKQRSKYICKPEAVVETGNHFIWEFIGGKGTANVPPDRGILHHYRVCEFGGDDCIKTPSVLDRTAHRYTKQLLERVDMRYNQLKHTCQLPELPPVPQKPTTHRPRVTKLNVVKH